MTEGHSGTSDTGRCHGCPCGRSHPKQGKGRRIRPPVDHGDLTRRVYDAFANGKLETDPTRHTIAYQGNCTAPLAVHSHASRGALIVKTLVRCRRCKNCLRARQFYWARTAMAWTEYTHKAGRRTWFGTLTLSAVEQDNLSTAAMWRWLEGSETGSIPDWWEDTTCDERFAFIRKELTRWCQSYMKRLRKGVKRCETCYPKKPRAVGDWDHPPAAFKYFLVFERHKSGSPHVHWLMHETDAEIRKKHLQCAWPFGFTQVKLVDGSDVRKAAFYVSKYLGKALQSRQIASRLYAKLSHSLNQSIE